MANTAGMSLCTGTACRRQALTERLRTVPCGKVRPLPVASRVRRLQVLQQGIPQGDVAIRRFDEQLGLAALQRQRFQLTDALRPLQDILGQVPDKGEVLAVQAAGGQGQQQRSRADQRHDRHAKVVRGPNDGRTGIRDRRHARFADEADVVPVHCRTQ